MIINRNRANNNVSHFTSGPGVKFIDYDGTLIEFWPASKVSSKIALPANPTGHTRLVAEGWNWTFANIKSYMASYPNAVMTVGQMYHTASGKTELDITVTKVTGKAVTCNISGTKDWGDGTTNTSSSHTYTNYGDYTIKCSGTTISGNIFGTSSSNMNRFWCTAAYIASGVTSIGDSAFYYCYSLASITIPDGVTSIGNSVFYYCYPLTSVTIPDGVTSIGGSEFYYCYSLASVIIPDSVTSIGGNAFYNCYSITKYDFSSATVVPTLTASNAFQNMNRICKIIVPDALYNSWKAATNWSTYADYIYKASEVTD